MDSGVVVALIGAVGVFLTVGSSWVQAYVRRGDRERALALQEIELSTKLGDPKAAEQLLEIVKARVTAWHAQKFPKARKAPRWGRIVRIILGIFFSALLVWGIWSVVTSPPPHANHQRCGPNLLPLPC